MVKTTLQAKKGRHFDCDNLISKKMFFEDREGTNADVNRSDPHKNTKLEEVSMIVETDAIIQPRFCIVKYKCKLKYKYERAPSVSRF